MRLILCPEAALTDLRITGIAVQMSLREEKVLTEQLSGKQLTVVQELC